MLAINNISVQFTGNYLFDKVTFNVDKNSRIGLIGRNGSGKTTLLRIIFGLMTPDSGTIIKSSDYKIGYLPQEITVSSDKSVYDEVRSSLIELISLEKNINDITNELSSRIDYSSVEYQKLLDKLTFVNDRYKILGGASIESEIEKVLSGLGFESSEFTRKLSEFSGGWQMRAELAKILLNKPDCILLDEPTNHLDIESIQWLQNFLSNYFGSIILVSHDRNFLNKVTNRTIEITLGKIFDLPVNYTKFIELRKEQKEQILSAFKNQQKQIEETEKFIDRFRYKANLASRVQSKIKQLEKIDRIELEEEDLTKIKLRFPEPPRSGKLVVEVKNLNKSYGDKLVLSDIKFELERGDKVAFVGRNGEGKSTFSRIIAGIESFGGSLELGYNVSRGYFAQNQSDLLENDSTVLEIIDNAATGDMRTQIRSLLGAFLFSGDSVYKKVKVLSGGEKSRLALAKMLLEPINLLILDEPTNHLDMVAKDVLKNALIEYSGALIVVSHDIDFLAGLTTKTVYFKNRNLTEYSGSIDNFLEAHNVENLNELAAAKAKPSNTADTLQKDKAARIHQKEIQREENRIRKQIASVENQIADFEKNISFYDSEFAKPGFFDNYEMSNKMQEDYKQLRSKLDEKMEEWTDLNVQLEDLIISNS